MKAEEHFQYTHERVGSQDEGVFIKQVFVKIDEEKRGGMASLVVFADIAGMDTPQQREDGRLRAAGTGKDPIPGPSPRIEGKGEETGKKNPSPALPLASRRRVRKRES
jgi:hypothetical protein